MAAKKKAREERMQAKKEAIRAEDPLAPEEAPEVEALPAEGKKEESK